MEKGKIKQKITADYILDIYEQSKKAKGVEASNLLAVAKTLSQHLNEWLVAEDIPALKKKKT